MKIALFIHTLSGGGVERSTIRLAKHFVKLGHQVDIVTFVGAGDMRLEAEKVARIIDFHAPWWIGRALKYLSYLWRNDPDIVIAATSGPNMLASLANGPFSRRRPVILSERIWDRFLHDRQRRWRAVALQKLMRVAYRRASAIVAVSRGVAERLSQLPRLRRDRIHVIYNPVWGPEIEALAREPVTDAGFDHADIPTIVSVGRLSSEKDFATLLRAFAMVRRRRSVNLVILGEGSMRGALEELVRNLGIVDDVFMPGYVANPFPHMAGADLFVLTSTSEGFGNVLVEAMGCGTPIVSTDCPVGPSEILAGGRYGMLVPVGDTVALAAAIEAQLDNPTSADHLRQRAREFSVEAAASAYLKLADSLRGRP